MVYSDEPSITTSAAAVTTIDTTNATAYVLASVAVHSHDTTTDGEDTGLDKCMVIKLLEWREVIVCVCLQLPMQLKFYRQSVCVCVYVHVCVCLYVYVCTCVCMYM